MNLCYLDESGTGNEPYAVMVGVVVNTYRMRPTKNDWSELLQVLSQIVGKPIYEIHTTDFYSGNGVWHKLPGEERASIISTIFNWFKERKHKIVYSAVNKEEFKNEFNHEPYAKEVGSLWCLMALHICLAIQKCFQEAPGTKGNTVLIFDKNEKEVKKITRMILNPPEWTDSYYNRGNSQERLDQIVDVPYFADSRHVGLIQLADFVSFFLRKYIELREGVKAKYEDEPSKITNWARIAFKQAIPERTIYLSKGRCECADFFYRYAPHCLQR